MSVSSSTKEEISLKKFKEKVINDFRTVSLSREVSIQGRREVLIGKGKFGIFGDGKELPQVVMKKIEGGTLQNWLDVEPKNTSKIKIKKKFIDFNEI